MMNDSYNRIKESINNHGILLLNSTPEFYNVMDLGGDWFTVIRLIEERHIFTSKLYKGKTTYLSRELYYSLRLLLPHEMMSADERQIYDFINASTNVDMEILKITSNMDSKNLRKILNKMQKNLLITVLHGGKKLNDNWSTYYYGTYEQWEKSDKNRLDLEEKRALENVYLYLGKLMSDRQIKNLIRHDKEIKLA